MHQQKHQYTKNVLYHFIVNDDDIHRENKIPVPESLSGTANVLQFHCIVYTIFIFIFMFIFGDTYLGEARKTLKMFYILCV